MSNIKNIDNYYDYIIETLNEFNRKIKKSSDTLFEIINALINLNVMTFPNELIMLYTHLRNQYDSLFSNIIGSNDDILNLAVKENLMIGYRDHLLILFIYMLLVIYQYSHVE
jgi:hypothetical protein